MSLLIAQLNAKQNKKLTRGELLALVPKKDYSDGRTKQAFIDETDINKLLQRAEKSGTISHLNKHQAHYVDFSDFDFFDNQLKLSAGAEIFADLPAELRSEFNQSPAQFFKYVNDPENKDRLGQLLPALAAPGKQNLDMRGTIPADEAKAALEAAETIPEPEAPEKEPEAPKAPEEPSSPST